jgi:hypothetical protein
MKRLAALFVTVLFALGLTGLATAEEPKKSEPAAKESTAGTKDASAAKETKAEKKEGKKDKKKDAKKDGKKDKKLEGKEGEKGDVMQKDDAQPKKPKDGAKPKKQKKESSGC